MAFSITQMAFLGGTPYTPPQGGGAAAPFFAPDIAGCTLWVEADLEFYSDTDPVTQWTDYSTNSNHLTEATNPPIFKTSIVHSKPVVRFDGIASILKVSAVLITKGAFSMFYVVNFKSFNSNNATPNLNECLYTENNVGSRSIYMKSNSGSPIVGFENISSGSNTVVKAVQAAAFCIYHVRHEGGRLYASINAGAETTTASADSTISDFPVFGQNFDATQFAEVDIAEIIVYDNAISAMDRVSVFAYLNTKYAIY